MNISASLEQLAVLVKGDCALDQSFFVQQLTSLDAAGPDDMAVVFDRGDGSPFDAISREQIAASKAGVILAREAIVPGRRYLLVADPLAAFNLLAQKNRSEPSAISPLASIAPDAVIGAGVSIGAFAVIESGAVIGAGSRIGAHTIVQAGAVVGEQVLLHPRVTIGAWCVIGNLSILHSGVVIGSDGFGYQVTRQGMRKIPHVGIVRVGQQVEIGAGCCIDRATFTETVIGDGCKLDNLVHVAHNVTIGRSCAILAQTGIAGGATIGSGCQIGGQVAIRDHVTIGDGVRIVSKSAVLNDIPAGSTVCGQPAVSFMRWKRLQVVLALLSEQAQRMRQLLKEGHNDTGI